MKIHGTAKGAALSTKDFGVAFGGAAPANEYCQSTYDEDYNLKSPQPFFVGVQLKAGHILIGETGTISKQYMKKVGSPTGTATCAVYTVANYHTAEFTFGTIDVSTLTTSSVQQTFTNTDGYVFQADDILGIYYTNGDSSNYATNTKANGTAITNEYYAQKNAAAWILSAANGNAFCVTY